MPITHCIEWTLVWTKSKTKKQAGLLSLILHHKVAVNAWQGYIDDNVE